MFGSHLSIAGGLHRALLQAHDLKMSCVQIFTKNQRQWHSKPLTPEQIQAWFEHRQTTGIQQIVTHDSYLINLASPEGQTRDRSIALFSDELTRCEALEIPWLVTHPGSHMGQGVEKGLTRVADALNQVHEQHPDLKVVTCLETTAGQGTNLGWRFEQLASIIQQCHHPHRLAICLDTAHMLAGGYDLTSTAGTRKTLKELDNLLGLGKVRVIHVNDSKAPLGSHVDRHAHIGQGHIAKAAFEWFLSEPAFAEVPKILETAKALSPKGVPWDVINLRKLKQLQSRGRSRRRSISSVCCI